MRPEPFENVIDRHYPSIYRLARRMTGRPAEAEDIAQKTFLNAYAAWSRFEGRSSVRTWLFRIAVNLCHRWYRERGRAPSSLEVPEAIAVEGQDDRFEERDGQVRRAIDELKPAQRLVLTLFSLDGMTHREVAGILGCPEGTVWSRLYHAKKALEQKIRANFPEIVP